MRCTHAHIHITNTYIHIHTRWTESKSALRLDWLISSDDVTSKLKAASKQDDLEITLSLHSPDENNKSYWLIAIKP